MKLNEAFNDIPDDEDLLYSIEHWDLYRIRQDYEKANIGPPDGLMEAFVHPRTGTASRIMESDGVYSVQPSMGGFASFDNVIQPDDPGEFWSGSASVTAMEIETLSEARAIAYYWMRGWVMRNSNIGEVRDTES